MVEHQSDPRKVEYPDKEELRNVAPRDTGEVFDIVVRKGPIGLDKMMRNQIHSMSRDDVYTALSTLLECDFVSRVDGDIEEHGTTGKVWYVPKGE